MGSDGKNLRLSLRSIVEQILSDGEWHSIGEIHSAAHHLVPPERALRRWRMEKGEPTDTEQAVRWGKQRIIAYGISNFVWLEKRGRRGLSLEARGQGVNREFRLKANGGAECEA